MNVENLETGWLQQHALDGIHELTIECDHVDFTIEVDENLSDMVQLVAQPAENAPAISRAGSELLIKQSGRYRGRVTPMLRLPATRCPEVAANIGKGDLSFQHVPATIVVKLGMGDVQIVDGSGSALVSIGKGDVAVVDRDGGVTVKSGMGDVALRRCTGAVSVALGKGDIAVVESGPGVSVKTGSGDIAVVRMQGGALVASAGVGDMSFNDGEASSVTAHTGKGDIVSSVRLLDESRGRPDVSDEDDDFVFDVDSEDFSLGDIHVEAGESGVRVARGNTDILSLGPDGIRFRGSKRQFSLGPDGIRVGGPDTGIEVERFSFETERGDADVAVPSDLNLRVELLATGDVHSDVPLVSVGRPGPRGTIKRFVGVLDGPGNAPRTDVRVSTKRGDVNVRLARVLPRDDAPDVDDKDDMDRDEQARVILEALARGDLSVNEADRLLRGLDSGD